MGCLIYKYISVCASLCVVHVCTCGTSVWERVYMVYVCVCVALTAASGENTESWFVTIYHIPLKLSLNLEQSWQSANPRDPPFLVAHLTEDSGLCSHAQLFMWFLKVWTQVLLVHAWKALCPDEPAFCLFLLRREHTWHPGLNSCSVTHGLYEPRQVSTSHTLVALIVQYQY